MKGYQRFRREQRQEEAAERKAAAASRTPEQQLRILRERGVSSGREWDKLIAKTNKGKGKVPNNSLEMSTKEVPND